MEAESAPRLDDLLAHASWVRALARSLVADPATADDVVQETWLAALRTPPREARNLRGWLGRVVSNAARQRGRGEARRVEREQLVAGEDPPPLPDPEELAQRVETQRRLAALVLELDEPLRTTMLLRFYEGLSAAEIGRRTNTPAGTVRWRVAHGLEELRARLDREHGGDRSAWCALLIPLVDRDLALAASAATAGGATGATAVLQGIVTMNLGLKLAVGATALVATFALTPLGDLVPGLAGEALETPEEVSFRPIVAAQEPAAQGTTATAGTTEGEARRSVPVQPVAPGAGPPTAAGLRVVDPAGAPVADAVVWLRGFKQFARRSGADGRARAELPGELPFESWNESVLVDHPDHVLHEVAVVLRSGETVPLGDVVLRPAGAVEGVVRSPDGQPIGGAWVEFEEPRTGGLAHLEIRALERTARGLRGDVVTDSRGAFRLERVPAGMVRIWAGADDWLATASAPVEVRGGMVSEGVDLTLGRIDPRDFIEGVVLDENGEPVPHAEIDARYASLFRGSGNRSFRADAQGRFRLAYAPQVPRTIRVSDPEGRFGPVSVDEVEGGVQGLVVRLSTARWLALEVRGSEGPIEAPAIAAMTPDRRALLASPDQVLGEDGLWRVPIPGEPFLVVVNAPGHGERELGPFDPGALAGDAPIECVLERLPGITGTVFAFGQPLVGAKLLLHEVTGEQTTHDGFPVRVAPRPRSVASTYPGGVFELTVREPGRYLVRAEAEGFAPAELGPFDVDPDLGRAGLAFDLDGGGTLMGYVLVPYGESAEGVVVAISRGDGHPLTQRVGRDGLYRFEHLTPGPWRVERRTEDISDLSHTTHSTGRPLEEADFREDCWVRAGETTRFDLHLGGAATAHLRGSLTLDGRPAEGWVVTLLSSEEVVAPVNPDWTVPTDGDGRFGLRDVEPGTWRIAIQSTGMPSLAFTLVEVLRPGENELDLAYDMAPLTVTNPGTLDGPAGPIDIFFMMLEDGTSAAASIFAPPGREGEPVTLQVPVGEGTLLATTLEELTQLHDPDAFLLKAEEEGVPLVIAPQGTTITLPLGS